MVVSPVVIFACIMLSNIFNKEVEQLFTTPIVQQTAFWSIVKKKLGVSTLAINFKSNKSFLYNNYESKDDNIVSDLLVIVRAINQNHSIAYVPYGPELEPDDEFQGLFPSIGADQD